MIKILYFQVCMTVLTHISNFQTGHVCNLFSVNVLVYVVFVAEINGDKDVDLTFINFHHYENFSSCSLEKELLPDHGKTCPF